MFKSNLFIKLNKKLFIVCLFFFNLNIVYSNEIIVKDILIIGGGPAGLILAKTCEKEKLSYILIEKNMGPTTFSKATGLHSRTMRYLYKLELSEAILNNSIKLDKNIIMHNGQMLKKITFSHGKLPYEKNLSISQEKLESIIYKSLNKKNILYDHKFIDYNKKSDIYIGKIIDKKTNLEKLVYSKFIVSAEGGHSSIRKKLNIPFKGETNPFKAFSFDAEIKNKEILELYTMYIFSNKHGRLVIVPINDSKYKIAGMYLNSSHSLNNENLKNIVYNRSKLNINAKSIRGKVKYNTHSRIVHKMNHDRIILIGDAAHVFYPAGGYGLNIAIKEAYLLGNFLGKNIKNLKLPILENFLSNLLQEAKSIKVDAEKKRKQSMDKKKEIIKENQAY